MHGEPSWCFLYRKMIPVLTAAGLPLHRARPRRLRSLRQADRAHRLHLRAPRRVDARRAVRRARPARRHARLPGLGRPHRPAARRRAPRSLRARRRREHVPADRRHAARARRSSAGSASRRRSRTSPSASSSAAAATTELARRRDRRVRRAVPRRHLQGGRAPVPDARADLARRSRRRPRTARRGRRCARATKPFLTAFSDEDPITRGGDRVFQREVPGCAGQPHTTIEGGGHFLQEDRGERARPGRRELDRRHT